MAFETLHKKIQKLRGEILKPSTSKLKPYYYQPQNIRDSEH